MFQTLRQLRYMLQRRVQAIDTRQLGDPKCFVTV